MIAMQYTTCCNFGGQVLTDDWGHFEAALSTGMFRFPPESSLMLMWCGSYLERWDSLSSNDDFAQDFEGPEAYRDRVIMTLIKRWKNGSLLEDI